MAETTDRRIDYGVSTPVEVKRKRPVAKGQGDLQKLYKPEYDEIASRLAAVGFNVKDIAHTFGVPVGAIESWKATYPTFKAVWRNGKRDQLRRMAAKAMLEAVGYDYQTSRVEVARDAEGNIKSSKEIVFTNHQAPQPNLLIFLLCNLSSQLGLDNEVAWKSRQKLEIENKSINLTISGTLVSEQITKLAGKLLGQPETKQIEAADVQFEPQNAPTIAQDALGSTNDSGSGSEVEDEPGGQDED